MSFSLPKKNSSKILITEGHSSLPPLPTLNAPFNIQNFKTEMTPHNPYMSNNYKDDSSTHAFRKEFNRQKEDLIAYVTLKRYLNSQNEMINNLIKKMNNSKKDKKKQEMEFLKHKLQSLESKILMKSLERNQLDFLSSMKKEFNAKIEAINDPSNMYPPPHFFNSMMSPQNNPMFPNPLSQNSMFPNLMLSQNTMSKPFEPNNPISSFFPPNGLGSSPSFPNKFSFNPDTIPTNSNNKVFRNTGEKILEKFFPSSGAKSPRDHYKSGSDLKQGSHPNFNKHMQDLLQDLD